MRTLLSLFLSVLVLSGMLLAPAAQAVTAQDCKEEVVRALENVIGVPGRTELHGYLKQLDDVMSTQMKTHQLLTEVEVLARDARLEVTGICQEVRRFDLMNDFYVSAYQLSSCKALREDRNDSAGEIDVIELCESRSEQLIDALLDSVRDIVLRQSVRTSLEPVVQRMRSLNARLSVLISEYSRLVNNFFTLSFRLGDTITGEVD